MALTHTTDSKLTDLRIERAMAKPGAIGMKGFLLWTEAAWPPAIARKILSAANRYTPGAGRPVMLASPHAQGFGALGDTSMWDISFDPSSVDVSQSATQAITDATQAPVSGTTAATPSQPASPSWLADISGAISAATTAFLGVQQVKDAQTIFNANLSRAQQGLPMLPTNPVRYGLPAPTANIGLAPSAQSTLLWVAGGLGAAILIGTLAKSHRRR